MRPKQQRTTRSGDLFRARLDQIINMQHELVQLAGKLDWAWLDGEIAPLYSAHGRPGIAGYLLMYGGGTINKDHIIEKHGGNQMEPETICNLPMIKAEYRQIEPITRPTHNGPASWRCRNRRQCRHGI